jgi:hypothetical protein
MRTLSFEVYEGSNRLTLPFASNFNEYSKEHIFNGKIYSKVSQEAKVNIVVDDSLLSFKLNGEEIFDNKKYNKPHIDYKYGEYLYLNLKSGENLIEVKSINKGGTYSFKIKKMFSYFEMFFLFITIFIPIFAFIFFNILDVIRKKSMVGFKYKEYLSIALAILIIGSLIRLIFYMNHSYMYYQHDLTAHIEFIKFFANHFEIPPPHKALEFPQQPLYYALMGTIFKITNSMWFVGFCSVILSIIALIYSYKTLKLLTDSTFVQNTALSFIAFTPSIVYLSSRINNDSLNLTLAVMTIYYIIKSYKSEFIEHFYKALFFASMLFLTKISSATIMLFFMFLLFATYFKGIKIRNKEAITNRLFIFGSISFLLLFFTILRIYLPVEGDFRFVESYRYPNQTIENLSLFGYFLDFNFSKLLEFSQSYVFESKGDEVRYSFLTYQFGTMLFGEFKYEHLLNTITILNPLMQLIYLFALIFVVGFISFWLFFKRFDFITKSITLIWIVNLILVLKFIFSYPSICNTDFRYYTPSFLILGFIFAKGLEQLTILRRVSIYSLSALAICEIGFLLTV